MVFAAPPSAPDANRRAVTAADLAAADPALVRAWLAGLTPAERAVLQAHWPFWARKAQRPPPGDWAIWLMLGGRGSGKTRAGAEWICDLVQSGRARRIALVGPTEHDVRGVMRDGVSGLVATAARRGMPVEVEHVARRVRWPNGACAHLFSAAAPDRLRGPQFDAAWGDELAYWRDADAVLSTLRLGLRLGAQPRLLLTTTPRPMSLLKRLLSSPEVAVTHSRSADNAANLADGFVTRLRTALREDEVRQELDGACEDAPAGALFTPDMIARARIAKAPTLERVVVAIDPPASSSARADACGIVVVGANGRGRDCVAYVLEDASVQGAAPAQWAAIAVRAAQSHNAACIVAEANTGGEMVRAVLHGVDPGIAVRLVRARLSKAARAAPVALHYARGHVFHAGVFAALEDEMLAFDGALSNRHSPDRMDALVWAILDHVEHAGSPQMRRL